MPLIDVPLYTDPAAWATAAAAHEQAEAAIRAAEIAAQAAIRAAAISAKATWDAALLQVLVGVPAALSAAGAAIYAAHMNFRSSLKTAAAAIKAAEHQVKLARDNHEARVKAYAIRQMKLIDSFLFNIDKYKGYISFLAEHFNDPDIEENGFFKLFGNTSEFIPEAIPREWKDEHWEDHALLGSEFIMALIKVRQAYSLFENVEIGSDLLKGGHGDLNDKKAVAQEILTEHGHYLAIYKERLEKLKHSFQKLVPPDDVTAP